jgi:hypothetical protein
MTPFAPPEPLRNNHIPPAFRHSLPARAQRTGISRETSSNTAVVFDIGNDAEMQKHQGGGGMSEDEKRAMDEHKIIVGLREAVAHAAGNRDLSSVAAWVGRLVMINGEGLPGTHGEVGTVLAVDDTHWQPSAWVRVHEDRDYPAYRSVNLIWLDDVETGQQGPNWGSESAHPPALLDRYNRDDGGVD